MDSFIPWKNEQMRSLFVFIMCALCSSHDFAQHMAKLNNKWLILHAYVTLWVWVMNSLSEKYATQKIWNKSIEISSSTLNFKPKEQLHLVRQMGICIIVFKTTIFFCTSSKYISCSNYFVLSIVESFCQIVVHFWESR